jgi:Ca2+/Na+ antiporter
MNKIGHTVRALWVVFVLAYIVGVSSFMTWTIEQEKFVILLPFIFFGAIALLFVMAHYFFKWFHKCKVFKNESK